MRIVRRLEKSHTRTHGKRSVSMIQKIEKSIRKKKVSVAPEDVYEHSYKVPFVTTRHSRWRTGDDHVVAGIHERERDMSKKHKHPTQKKSPDKWTSWSFKINVRRLMSGRHSSFRDFQTSCPSRQCAFMYMLSLFLFLKPWPHSLPLSWKACVTQMKKMSVHIQQSRNASHGHVTASGGTWDVSWEGCKWEKGWSQHFKTGKKTSLKNCSFCVKISKNTSILAFGLGVGQPPKSKSQWKYEE